jgi:hypothetical protein
MLILIITRRKKSTSLKGRKVRISLEILQFCMVITIPIIPLNQGLKNLFHCPKIKFILTKRIGLDEDTTLRLRLLLDFQLRNLLTKIDEEACSEERMSMDS